MVYYYSETLLHVRDYASAVQFYRDKLGWTLLQESEWGFATFMVEGEGKIGVLKWTEDPLPPPKFAIQTDDIEAFVAEMATKGIRTDAIKGQPGSTRCVNFFDPDGNAFFVWDDGSGKIG